MAEVTLRAVEDADLPLFFAWMSDADATRVAAFTPEDPTDRAAFDARWARIRSGSGGVVMRTVLADGVVVGHVGAYGEAGGRQVTDWIARAHWGRGLATAALRAFLDETSTRPLHARAAADNLGSRRVLEKCGFVVTGTDRGFARARGEEIDEVLVTLRA
ncbi:GNAT family N-acetyltransferase [Streptomyces sindenensis]|uniref:GNAT family N-acetyltransferase n=1 Tax=Streptomyces sindenensis TaxID=67363 RepID=UPI00167939B4|nr:GNAT family N-acetyltransferase [Streptomyces sindenensis]GGP70640.1 N-acetyltransferase [Streptomyces sindenensis]